MKLLLATVALCLVSTVVFAQQPAERPMTVIELKGALSAAIEQGNFARSMHIQAKAEATGLADELAKAVARIKELEPKTETKKP